MKANQPRSRLWQRVRLGAVALVAIGATGPACLSRPLEPQNPRTTSTILEKLTSSGVDKIDLLLAVDNSGSMADKQEILNVAVPDLVQRLVNPRCVDEKTMDPVATQPTSPSVICPVGSVREFQPVLDIHIGLVDSSLGSHGADTCPDLGFPSDCANNATNYSNNDHGHLLTRKDPCGATEVPTYQNLGFLAWDPTGKKDTPSGETMVSNLTTSITELVTGEGQIGCGFESQEEGWYRFLVDTNPYQSIAVVNGQAVKTGRDDALLKQRADFLRPSSLLAILVLTDENDGSAREGGEYYAVEQQTAVLPNGTKGAYHLPPARAECTTNPNDKCCLSCVQTAQATALGCPADPTCSTGLTELNDPINLRMFDDKRRFGIDFLYPWQRYVNALSQTSINPNNADLVLDGAPGVPNPIFSDLQMNPNDTTIRTPDLVFLAGIVGVPWQDIARDPKDLTQGYKAAVGPNGVNELTALDANKHSTWDIILGDPDNYVPPLDPFMIEQIKPRSGTNPITGDSIEQPGSATKNGINGTEWSISQQDDLQYACIFTLPTPKPCLAGDLSCDCTPGNPDNDQNPLCDPNPADGMKKTLQARAKGYPGRRHLQVLKGLGDQAIVASVCPAQTKDTGAADYGYRPAVGAIIDRLKSKLSGQCLPRTLTPDTSGNVPCLIIEASKSSTCNCNAPGRLPIPSTSEQAVEGAKADPNYATEQWNCFCEIEQLSNPEGSTTGPRDTCQQSMEIAPTFDGKSVDGWCYVDDTTIPAIGNPSIVAQCPATEKRIVHFVGAGKGATGATLFITCSGDNN